MADERAIMKAIRLHGRGGPEQILYEDAPKPDPQSGYVLVRVFATGITPTELSWDDTYKTCDGAERIPSIPGHEFSGVVERITPGVSEVKVGDAVYGLTEFCQNGTAAEHVAARGADLAPKPRTLAHSAAAAVPLSALTAWQAFFDYADLKPGDCVLIHGAAGGVGTYAVQLAKWRGAHVVGTASPGHFEFLRGLGVDDLVDYTTERFDEKLRDLDVVVDTRGGDTLERSWTVLRRGGILVSIVGMPSPEKAARHDARGAFFIVRPKREQLIEIAGLIDSGKVRPIIADTLPLERAREAFERGLKGHLRGKIVLRVVEEEAAAT